MNKRMRKKRLAKKFNLKSRWKREREYAKLSRAWGWKIDHDMTLKYQERISHG